MLDFLHQTEAALPELLREEGRWKSLFVNYHAPFVERLSCDWQGGRVYMHKIHPCGVEDALFHPHPWPSAMKVLQGGYEMAIGYGAGTVKPPAAVRLMLGAGSEYEMTHPDGWHYVRPINRPSFSLMVTGNPWVRESPKSDKQLFELPAQKRFEILQFFRSVYE